MIRSYSKDTLEIALSLLSNDQIIGMPTESVYGLAADATSDIAVARIYETKERPAFNPLIIHVDSIEMAKQWGIFTPLAEKLADIFWGTNPSSLTLILKCNNDALSHLVTAGLDTVAIRIPIHPIARELISKFGSPLAAPSANKSNHISPTSARAVEHDLGNKIKLIIDGGPCTVGLESTILDVTGDKPILLRPGGTTVESIESALSQPVIRAQDNFDEKTPRAPGMLKRHYAPSIPLRLNADSPLPGEAFLAFGQIQLQHNSLLNLSTTCNLTEAAANLFKMMRQLDNPSHTGIAVSPIPNTGIGLAINDRLNRASTL